MQKSNWGTFNKENLLLKKKKKLERNCFFYSEYGKPFIKTDPTFYFNISHSGEWIVCAISKEPVGIDIEKIVDIDLNDFNSILNENDIKNISRSIATKENFFEFWSIKESVSKLTGEGLHKDFKEIIITETQKNHYVSSISFKKYVYSYSLNILKEYSLCYSTNLKIKENIVNIFYEIELYGFFKKMEG